MASKMLAALDEKDSLITVSMAEQGKYSDLLKCEFCNIPVEFVKAFTRKMGEDTIAVKPFFRRKRKQDHSETCRYNIPGQIKIIAEKSEHGLFAAIQGNRYELRLLAVQQLLEELGELEHKKRNLYSEAIQGTGEKVYVEAAKRLTSYVNSAQRVLKLRAACEDHSEIEDALHLVFDGIHLRWGDFYFEHEDYFECFSKVKATVGVPIAVRGIIKNKNVVKNSKLAVINLVEKKRKTDQDDVLDCACFSIWSNDLSAFQDYEKGREILAFGIWGSPKVNENSNKNSGSPIKNFQNHELSLWPVIKSQLCTISGNKIKLRSAKDLNP